MPELSNTSCPLTFPSSDLLTFYIEGEVHSHPAYLVDALMDMAPFIKDWNTMVDILLSDYCKFLR